MNHRTAQRDTVSVERLDKAVQALAFIVMRHGDQYGELLEWLDDELQQRQRAPSARDRAREILNRSLREVPTHAHL